MTALFVMALLGATPTAPFAIKVVDEETGRGVPLVELRTVHNLRYVTDSNGLVAFHEPGLMNESVYFTVVAHGYEHAKDGFGFRGKALDVRSGGTTTLKVKRLNRAERLYRVTGAGIYADTLLLGQQAPLQEPLLNGRVVGQDSVLNTIYQGKLFWVWGDTNQPSYPLGNYQAPGAVSDLPAQGGLDPAVGVNLRYFVDGKGFAKKLADMPGEGPTWITALVTLKEDGRERLYCAYIKVKGSLTIYARGLAVFDDVKQQFRHVKTIDMKAPLFANGHAFQHRDGDRDYLYFAYSYALVRVPATVADFTNPDAYEAYTCLQEGTRVEDAKLDRAKDGTLRYAWKKNTPAVGAAEQAKLVQAKKLAPHEGLLQLRDRDTGTAVTAHAGATEWNPYRQRWTLLTCEHFGKSSLLGELWYAEAPTITGPWTYAVKVVTHDKYSFYNPKWHPYFAQEGGKIVYFEGTYTHTFSGNTDQTPRYDYNQIMYRLNLGDARNALPSPVAEDGTWVKTMNQLPAFYAHDRAVPGTTPLPIGTTTLHLWPTNSKEAPAATTPLYRYTHTTKAPRFSTHPKSSWEGYHREEAPLGRVWKNTLPQPVSP